MKRRWKIAIGVVIAFVALLSLNAIALNNQTKGAEVTVDGAQIVSAFGGDVQVTDSRGEGSPIVLLHCYSCSTHWWEELEPLLEKHHRVISIDLIGHGGSEKPAAGYSMTDQASTVASVLSGLGVSNATVVGHSMGFAVATALAEESPGLVARLVDIDQAPSDDFGSPPFLAQLSYVPLIGQAMARVTPDFAVRDAYKEAFAPGFNFANGFENPDQPVDDQKAMTYTSFKKSAQESDDFGAEQPLDERLAGLGIPLLVIMGAEDQLYDDPQEAADAYKDVPGAQITMIEGSGHSPNVEKPEETSALILEFAADPGDEHVPPAKQDEFVPPNKQQAPAKGGKKKQKQAPAAP